MAELDGVEVVPDPPTLAPYYASADVAIVPVQSGAGTRIKILEAFSFGVPVVSTELAAEGLDLVGGTDLLFGDTAEDFAAACLDLMRDPALRDRLVERGLAVFEERFGPDRLARCCGKYPAERGPDAGRMGAAIGTVNRRTPGVP